MSPPGGQIGTTTVVTVTGTFDRWPVEGWADAPGIAVKAEAAKGSLAITVAGGTTPGLHWIRLYDEGGATNLKPFVVGPLPEVTEDASHTDPQTLPSESCTVNGRLARRGEVDAYAVRLAKGRTLVASVLANRLLGSPMDAVLQVASADGIVLAQNDDWHGLDPQVAFAVPADGTYLVRLFAFPAVADSSIQFAGGEAFVYRLTITTAGYLEYPFPLAVSRTRPGTVEAHGWNVPDVADRLPVVPNQDEEVARVGHPTLAGTAEVGLVAHDALVEVGPSDSAHPMAITLPVTVSSRINPARDRDVYAFAAKKGRPVVFLVEARALGSPLDPVLRVTDAAGKSLAEVDDSRRGRDAELTFSPPSDATYHLVVRDLHGDGGDRFVYRLDAGPPAPDFRLTLASDRFTVSPGKPLSLPVSVERSNGFDRAIEVRAAGLPEGVEAAPVVSSARGGSARSVTITLLAKGATTSVPFRLIGKVQGEPACERTARVPVSGTSLSISEAWLTVLQGDSKQERPEESSKTR